MKKILFFVLAVLLVFGGNTIADDEIIYSVFAQLSTDKMGQYAYDINHQKMEGYFYMTFFPDFPSMQRFRGEFQQRVENNLKIPVIQKDDVRITKQIAIVTIQGEQWVATWVPRDGYNYRRIL
ncbi:MAG: hypothetical protein FWE72_09475 [Spirochaetaceae bacterium]|nr:hypothetical protein [Spirochaetaceae bacterium]